MKTTCICALAILFFAGRGFCGKEVVFIGLSGEGAPAIEKTFTRLLQEQLVVMTDVHVVDDVELQRLRARIENFTYPHFTAPLLGTLSRFVPDSSLVIWGMVKEHTVKPVRRFLIKAALSGTLTIELAIYNLADRSCVYAGDATASTEVAKGFVFFGPVEEDVQISALDREEVFNALELKAASASGRVIQALISHENSQKTKRFRDTLPPPGNEKKSTEAVPMPIGAAPDTVTATASSGVAARPAGAPLKTSAASVTPVFSPAVKLPDSGAAAEAAPAGAENPDTSATAPTGQ